MLKRNNQFPPICICGITVADVDLTIIRAEMVCAQLWRRLPRADLLPLPQDVQPEPRPVRVLVHVNYTTYLPGCTLLPLCRMTGSRIVVT